MSLTFKARIMEDCQDSLGGSYKADQIIEVRSGEFPLFYGPGDGVLLSRQLQLLEVEGSANSPLRAKEIEAFRIAAKYTDSVAATDALFEEIVRLLK